MYLLKTSLISTDHYPHVIGLRFINVIIRYIKAEFRIQVKINRVRPLDARLAFGPREKFTQYTMKIFEPIKLSKLMYFNRFYRFRYLETGCSD